MPGSPICLDASFVVRLVTGDDDDPVHPMWERWVDEGREFIAPVLMRFEVTNALYGYLRNGTRTPETTIASLRFAVALPIQIEYDENSHEQALNFTVRFKIHAAYDAHYLVLSERLGAEFWTADKRMVNSVRHAFPWVNFLEPWPLGR